MITYDTAVVIMIRDPMLTALDTATPVINSKERRKEGDGGVCVGKVRRGGGGKGIGLFLDLCRYRLIGLFLDLSRYRLFSTQSN
jgi:hypothetical protein